MPGVLIEIGFLSNDAEAELLSQDAYLDKIAQAILAGIQQATSGEKTAP
jgi:N-acetylmuramoyl-L-alanine amidase